MYIYTHCMYPHIYVDIYIYALIDIIYLYMYIYIICLLTHCRLKENSTHDSLDSYLEIMNFCQINPFFISLCDYNSLQFKQHRVVQAMLISHLILYKTEFTSYVLLFPRSICIINIFSHCKQFNKRALACALLYHIQ